MNTFHLRTVTQLIHELSRKLTWNDFESASGNQGLQLRCAAANYCVPFLRGRGAFPNINWKAIGRGNACFMLFCPLVSYPEVKLTSGFLSRKMQKSY